MPYRYVGDGKVVIEGLCPDFIGNNGIKRIIEVFGDVFHNPDKSFKEVPYHLTEEGRKKFFAEHGFDTLILWVSEMNKMSNSEIAQAIIKFKVEV